MGLVIGSTQLDGLAIGGTTVGGAAIGAQVVYRKTSAPPGPVDRPGTLTIGASRTGARAIAFATVLSDPDGIRSITSARGTRQDGRTVDYDMVRRDANSFIGRVTSRGNVWRSGSLTIVYVDDASGESRTLTATWSV